MPQYEKLYDTWKGELDFTLLSMHQVDNKEFWNQDFQTGKTQDEYNMRYREEILAVQQQFKHYCVLAHLSLLVRYDEAGVYPFEKVRDILRLYKDLGDHIKDAQDILKNEIGVDTVCTFDRMVPTFHKI